MALEVNNLVLSENQVLLMNLTPEDYFKQRVNAKIVGLHPVEPHLPGMLFTVGSLSIISSAAVPVLINTNIGLISPTIVSLVVTILVALERLFRFREHWRNFNYAEEALESGEISLPRKSRRIQR